MSRAPPQPRRSGHSSSSDRGSSGQQRGRSGEEDSDESSSYAAAHRGAAAAVNTRYAQQIYVVPTGPHNTLLQQHQQRQQQHQPQQHPYPHYPQPQPPQQPRPTFLHDSQPVWTPHGSEVYPAAAAGGGPLQQNGWALAAASAGSTPASASAAAMYTPSHPANANGAAQQHAQYPLVSPPSARGNDPARRNGHHHHSSSASARSQSQSRSRSPPRPASPGSPYDKHRKLPTSRRCCVSLRVWWASRGGLLRASLVALGLLLIAALFLWANNATVQRIDPGDPSQLLAQGGGLKPSTPVSVASSTDPLQAPSSTLLVRLRKSLKRFGRDVGLLAARAPRKLGDFEAGGARGRCPLPEGTPDLVVAANSVSPAGSLKHAPLMSHLLSRSGFTKFLSSQAESLRTERTAAAIAANNANPGSAPSASAQPQPTKWLDNPWSDPALSSKLDGITLFTVVPDSLSLAVPARKLAARRRQLALHLLALSSWVELIAPQKVHLFVLDAESCLGLVGHDGSALGRGEAIERAHAAAAATKSNRLAAVHCHVLPSHCVHAKFQRALMSCVWDQAHAAAVEEGLRRQADALAERTEALRNLRASRPLADGGEGGVPLLDPATGSAVRYSAEMEAQLERSLSSLPQEGAEQEVMLYVAPTSLFDMQLLTALARMMHDSMAAQSAWLLSASSASAAASDAPKPNLGTDVSGALIPDTGHFFAIGRRMDLVLSAKALEPFVPASATSAAAASPAQLFHAPSSSFDATVESFLESLWKRAYVAPSASSSADPSAAPGPAPLAVHSGFGLDFMALRASTYGALAADHAQAVQAEQQAQEDADDESATDGATERLTPAEEMLRARMGLYSRAVADLSPADVEFLLSSAPASSASSSSSFFPPFLAGLFRWANWLVSKLVLQRSPFGVKVTDLSASASLLHLELEEPEVSASAEDAEQEARDKAGARYNEVLVRAWSGNAYRIGSVDSAPWLSVGSCALDRMLPPVQMQKAVGYASPAVIDPQAQALMSPSLAAPLCGIVPRPAGNYSSLFFFTKHASAYPAPSGYLIILTVNSGYISLALNWLCWARRIRFENYILLAEDQQSARVFRALGAPVIVPATAAEDLPPSDYGSVAFQKTMSFRTEFLLDVLLAGFHFVTADMDALWFGNPIVHFPVAADLSGQTHKDTKISGGFVVVRSSTYGRFFWQRVIECQRMNAAYLADPAHPKGSYEPSLYTEQYCINELSIALEKKQAAAVPPPAIPFRRILLDALQFPDGRSFFTQHLSQLSAAIPVVIHNNWVLGTEGKLARLRDWNMVSIAGPDASAAGKDGLQKAMELGRRSNPARDLAVCVPEVILPRGTTLPAKFLAPSRSSPSPSSPQLPPPTHPFHMHIRLFLSPQASDGVDQGSAEFASLHRSVQSLIDTDWKSARTLDASGAPSVPVDPTVHVEIMVDHFAAAEDVSADLYARLLAEFERLKVALKAVKKNWVDAFGEPGSAQNKNRFVMEIKRPSAAATATGGGAAAAVAKKRVGNLGLWIMPWPKLYGSAEQAESEEEVGAEKERHHDLSLYLQDSVYLSRHWFTVAHASLSRFLLSPSVADSEVDPRVYGLSLLDSHEVYGETEHQRYDPADTRRSQRHFEAQPFFNASTGVFRMVREKAAALAMSTQAKSGDRDGRSLLPQTFLQARHFAFQGLSAPGALLWLPRHFADFAAFVGAQHIPDTYVSEATPLPVVSDGPVVQPRGTKCVPTLWSNHAILTKPAPETWSEWINRWAFLRGFYALHSRATLVRVTQGLAPKDLQAAREGRAAPRLRAKDTGARHAVAITSDQAKSGEVTLIDKLSPFDLLHPSATTAPSTAASSPSSSAAAAALSSSPSFFPVFDFHFRRVELPSTLSSRALLYPAATSVVTGASIEGLALDACYTLDRRASSLATLAAAEAAALEAERARKRAENEAKKKAAKAAADAKAKAAASAAAEAKQSADKKKQSGSKDAAAKAKSKSKDKPSGGSKPAKTKAPGSDKKSKAEADKKKAAAAAAAAKKKQQSEEEE